MIMNFILVNLYMQFIYANIKFFNILLKTAKIEKKSAKLIRI